MTIGQREHSAEQPRFERIVARLDAYALKIVCFCGLTVGLFFASIPLHEVGHWLAAKIMGISGSIHFYDALLGGGRFIPDYFPVGSPQAEIIAFAGGGFVALVFLVLWLFLPYKKKWFVTIPVLGTVAWCLGVAVMELACYL
jgi:hypothetical protein